jgi:mannose-6-phosphate isomerase
LALSILTFTETICMTATLLGTKRVDKPWGRRDLWPGFSDPAKGAGPVGEVWFQTPHASEPELLIKYLFTSERLSVQVHPDDETARVAGYPRGKDEAWVILAAEPHATIALGTKAPMSKDELRASALDGSIVDKLDWKPVKAGEFYYSPAGTIHAIGPGLTLVEIQQNVDLTYRLYDYGSDRELHLDAGIAASDPVPFVPLPTPQGSTADREILAEGPKFVIERWPGGHRVIDLPEGKMGWFVPLAGEGAADGVAWKAGECLTLTGRCEISTAGAADLLLAYPGEKRI